MNLRSQSINISAIIISVFFSIGITSFLQRTNSQNLEESEKVETVDEESSPVVQIVRLKTSLEEEELMKIAKERAVNFRALSGLQQKYYLRLGAPGEYAGVYIWKSKEEMMKFAKSDLAASIKDAYSVEGKPSVEISDVLFSLRD